MPAKLKPTQADESLDPDLFFMGEYTKMSAQWLGEAGDGAAEPRLAAVQVASMRVSTIRCFAFSGRRHFLLDA
jgi:hypothetical protein